MPSFEGNRSSSDPQRSASVRTSTNSHQDDEEYDLMSAIIVDGFRPPASEPTTTPGPSAAVLDVETTSQMRPPSTALDTPNSAPTQRPSSVTKPTRAYDPLTLRHDGVFGQPVSSSHLSRTSTGSYSVDSATLRPANSDQTSTGTTQPHPSYPERTLSVATSTTAPVSERSYQGPQRPTHPYGLYTQTTESAPSGDVTIGFGRPDNYERRIGPDGEEVADLIGPLGHTEALPPYTRYPEVSYTAKPSSSSEVPETSTSQTTEPPSQTIPGAGGIGLATRNPEYESRDDLNSPPSQSRLSTRSLASDGVSQHESDPISRPSSGHSRRGCLPLVVY